MISHKYRCIYIHIPKCAGTSVESALGHLDDYHGRGEQDHRSLRLLRQPLYTSQFQISKDNLCEVLRRIRYPYLKQLNPNNHITVTTEQFSNYFKFTIVRNPWSRAYSWYKNVMRDDIHKKNIGIDGHLSLYEFLKRYAGKSLLRPQTYWIKDYNGEIPLDKICRFENLKEDFLEVCRRLGEPQIVLPHLTKGANDNYRDHYCSESRKIIEDVYRNEIQLFDYSF